MMIRGAGAKYILYSDGEEFLYDLVKDPGETRNLAGERSQQPRIAEMKRELQAWQGKI